LSLVLLSSFFFFSLRNNRQYVILLVFPAFSDGSLVLKIDLYCLELYRLVLRLIMYGSILIKNGLSDSEMCTERKMALIEGTSNFGSGMDNIAIVLPDRFDIFHASGPNTTD
jgi:hypothetical protein